MIRVGYLGPEATFTNMAVSRFFPEAAHEKRESVSR